MTAEKRYSKYFISPFSVKISAIIPRLEAETQSVRGKKSVTKIDSCAA